ncbi:phage N-6-adenine-methyltransferase [Pasteurella multocida]|uniref:phage N-6-adenine-methyltransferase n=1 Tax=Pasteurella multocida TaxID=747 RepID=UPI001F53D64B|nr:phage N-6-adenine-methyltransferase [Pasteurella multocida]
MEIKFNKDHYRTPKYAFNWLNKRFEFHIDGCASQHNTLCTYFIGDGLSSIADDYLTFNHLEQVLEFVNPMLRFFVNPPYSNPKPFITRSIELMKAGHLVAMLLPADKSTKWFQLIEENATEIIDIVGGRINFLHPVTGEEVKGNNKGSLVAVFDPTMQGFITRSVSLDFVKQQGGYAN